MAAREPATEMEKRLLVALAWMCQQYLSCDIPGVSDYLDHECMGAGEGAVALLAEYGLVDSDPRGGTWTEAGNKLLDS